MLRAAKKNLTNLFKLTYLGGLPVSLQADITTEFNGTLKYGTINDFEAILVAGCDNELVGSTESTIIDFCNKYNGFYDTLPSTIIIPVAKPGNYTKCCILETDYDDSSGCQSSVYRVTILDNKIDAILSKRTAGNLVTDKTLNAILVYGLGEKKLSFFNAKSLPKIHYLGGEITC